jgi:hypothetical protein
MGNAYVNAPDQAVRLGYLPEGDDDALWKITAYSDPFAMPRWLVTYQDSTPTEIVQGFTTALAAAYAEGPDSYLYYGNSQLAALDVGTPLAAADWSHRYGAADISFDSPDGLAEVHLRRNRLDHAAEMTGHQERWLMLAGPPGNRWYATASSLTPEGLVAAMNTALTDPAGHRKPSEAAGADAARRTPRPGCQRPLHRGALACRRAAVHPGTSPAVSSAGPAPRAQLTTVPVTLLALRSHPCPTPLPSNRPTR